MTQVRQSTLNLPLNRVEGDLEIRVTLDGGVVTDSWSSAPTYLGIESILRGRAPMDALVIGARVCGMCSSSHLLAAAGALDALAGARVPDNGRRVRNLVLMAEHAQSDMRHAFLLFCADLAGPAYGWHPLHEEAHRRYAPLRGDTAIQTIQQTRQLLELVAILAGQWPHSAFAIPGGVTSCPGDAELLLCRNVLARFQRWYEQRVLGCSLERWREVHSLAELDCWVEENDAQRDGELGFFVRFAREAGFQRLGRGHGNFVSFGSLEMPVRTAVKGADAARLVSAGFAGPDGREAFDQRKVREHVSHSWYADCPGGVHPSEGRTQPFASGSEGQKYSWAKAPRYADRPAETGPLAELVLAGDPLVADMLARHEGPSVFSRELARMVRPATLLPAMSTWLDEISSEPGPFCEPFDPIDSGQALGLLQASRGALGHWVQIERGKIERYQIITPTAWNGSPRDDGGVRGPWEEALLGTAVRDEANPVEVAHVIRSFDPCMVCSVHAYRGRGRLWKLSV